MKIKSFLSKKTGVTLLEGLIAIALLALVASGTFGVLLSVSRKSDQPDRREDMIYAIDSLNDLLKAADYYVQDSSDTVPDYIRNALCASTYAENVQPLSNGSHRVKCLLPPSCDANQSDFTYTVSVETINLKEGLGSTPDSTRLENKYIVGSVKPNSGYEGIPSRKIKYDITCNGYSL